MAHADDKAKLGGQWNFNADQSDDAQQKVQDAQQNSKSRSASTDDTYPGGGGTYPGSGGTYPGSGGTYPGGGMGRIGGGMGGPGGGMGRGRGGTNNPASAISPDTWDRVAQSPKALHIDLRSDQVVITDDSDNAQAFYPDGKKHDEKDSDGKKYSTKASWDQGAFVAETRLPHAEKITETFRTTDDGKQLTVLTRFEAPALQTPLIIRRVYDIAKAAAK